MGVDDSLQGFQLLQVVVGAVVTAARAILRCIEEAVGELLGLSGAALRAYIATVAGCGELLQGAASYGAQVTCGDGEE